MKFEIPKIGDTWRHYKGKLYTIVGTAVDDQGVPQVVYTDHGEEYHRARLYVQQLARFLQHVEVGGPVNFVPRFKWQGHAKDAPWCQYVNKEPPP